MSDPTQWFVRFRGRTTGPFTEQEIKAMSRRGQIARMHELSPDGAEWIRTNRHPVFARQDGKSVATVSGTDSPTDALHDGYDFEEVETGSVGKSPYGPVVDVGDFKSLDATEAATQGGAPVPSPDSLWFYVVGDQQIGPVSEAVLRQMAVNGQVHAQTLAWKAGMSLWTDLGTLGLCPHGQVRTPQAPVRTAPVASAASAPAQSNSQISNGTVWAGYVLCVIAFLWFGPAAIVAFILAIVNLSLGRIGHGIAQLLLSMGMIALWLLVLLAVLAGE